MSRTRQLFLHGGIVLFGLILGLVSLAIGLEVYGRVVQKLKRGSQFSSVQELQSEMVKGDEDADPAQGSVSLRSLIFPNPDDKIIYDLRPSIEVNFQKVPVRINSCGMRGGEVAITKAPGTYRIALLGDSFAFGWGVKEDESFAAVMERSLNRHSHGSPRFEVLNFGVPGYSTFQEVHKFITTDSDFNPDAVLVYFINNDWGYPFFVRDTTKVGGFLSGFEFARLTWRAMNPEVETQKLFLEGLDPNASMIALSDFTREHGMKLSIAINPYRKWEQDRSRMKVLRKRRDIEVIDLREPLNHSIEVRGIPTDTLQLVGDPHPSAVKHEIIGEILATSYLPYVSK